MLLHLVLHLMNGWWYLCLISIGVWLNKERDCVAIGTVPWYLNGYSLFFCLFGYFVMDQQADAAKEQGHG